MKPYYEHAGITIYHGDCRDALAYLEADRTITDPPYGVGDMGGGIGHDYKKTDYKACWIDSPGYVQSVVTPTIWRCLQDITPTVVVTPGTRCCCFYPQPDDVGCFFAPAATGIGRFGFQNCQPIFYYGEYKNAGKSALRTSFVLTERSEVNGHPCPKPYKAWKWLVNRVALPGETVLDPFCGSGTTLIAAKSLGMKAIGIEIEEKYCEIAVKRLSLEVLQFESDG